MKILTEISDSTLGLGAYDTIDATFKLRKSARAIIEKDDGTIAVQFLSNPKFDFHKLPGGGIEKGESNEEALRREIMEEVGGAIEILGEIGMVIEYRSLQQIIQISYCYHVRIVGEISAPTLEPAEINEGMVTLWETPEEVIAKMERDEPQIYQGNFILQRELAFLREFVAIKIL